MAIGKPVIGLPGNAVQGTMFLFNPVEPKPLQKGNSIHLVTFKTEWRAYCCLGSLWDTVSGVQKDFSETWCWVLRKTQEQDALPLLPEKCNYVLAVKAKEGGKTLVGLTSVSVPVGPQLWDSCVMLWLCMRMLRLEYLGSHRFDSRDLRDSLTPKEGFWQKYIVVCM